MVGLCVISACTAPQQTAAYRSIGAAETVTITANQVFLDSVVAHTTPTNSVPQIEAAFNTTQMALHAAAIVASGGNNAPVPASVAAQVTQFTNAVAQTLRK